jgi:hypothetical protein
VTVNQTPPNAPAPKLTSREALRRGWLNVAMDRWAPKTQPARIIFEFALLIPVVLALAIVVKLSQG